MSNLNLGSYQTLEFKRIENINDKVGAMVNSKTPMDCLLTLLKTIKETFKAVSRCSIFLVSPYIQAYVLEGQEKNIRHYRQLQLQDKKIIYALSSTEKDQCNPCFTIMQQARKVFFQPKMISIPVFDTGALWFTVQIESDSAPLQGSNSLNRRNTRLIANSPRRTLSTFSNSQRSPPKFKRSKTIFSDVASSHNESGRRLNSVWSFTDLNVAKILVEIARVRIQVFTNKILMHEK